MHTSIYKIFYTLCLCITLFLSACSYNVLPAEKNSTPPPVSKPKNIALLLPLEGPNGSSGQAIRNGFLAAYYYTKQTLSSVPTVNVIDTSGGNIIALYQQAVEKGADFVVGPLIKQDLQTLINQGHLTVPTLALNTLDNTSGVVENLYQFSLSQQDEAEQTAIRAKQDGYSHALLIVPAGNWGAEIAQSFTQKWQQQGGDMTGTFTYPLSGNMSVFIRNALAKARQNTDVIFLAAFPTYARQINPFLTRDDGSHFPVYGTSLLYEYENPPTGKNHSLNGILFDDMPWIIGSDTSTWHQIRSNIQTLWGNSYNRSPRLYAFGIDAYHLTYTLNQLSSGVDGTTGKLTVGNHQRIYRTLDWAKFQDGLVQRVP